jgi:hypothetical protein
LLNALDDVIEHLVELVRRLRATRHTNEKHSEITLHNSTHQTLAVAETFLHVVRNAVIKLYHHRSTVGFRQVAIDGEPLCDHTPICERRAKQKDNVLCAFGNTQVSADEISRFQTCLVAVRSASATTSRLAAVGMVVSLLFAVA